MRCFIRPSRQAAPGQSFRHRGPKRPEAKSARGTGTAAVWAAAWGTARGTHQAGELSAASFWDGNERSTACLVLIQAFRVSSSISGSSSPTCEPRLSVRRSKGAVSSASGRSCCGFHARAAARACCPRAGVPIDGRAASRHGPAPPAHRLLLDVAPDVGDHDVVQALGDTGAGRRSARARFKGPASRRRWVSATVAVSRISQIAGPDRLRKPPGKGGVRQGAGCAARVLLPGRLLAPSRIESGSRPRPVR